MLLLLKFSYYCKENTLKLRKRKLENNKAVKYIKTFEILHSANIYSQKCVPAIKCIRFYFSAFIGSDRGAFKFSDLPHILLHRLT